MNMKFKIKYERKTMSVLNIDIRDFLCKIFDEQFSMLPKLENASRSCEGKTRSPAQNEPGSFHSVELDSDPWHSCVSEPKPSLDSEPDLDPWDDLVPVIKKA